LLTGWTNYSLPPLIMSLEMPEVVNEFRDVVDWLD